MKLTSRFLKVRRAPPSCWGIIWGVFGGCHIFLGLTDIWLFPPDPFDTYQNQPQRVGEE